MYKKMFSCSERGDILQVQVQIEPRGTWRSFDDSSLLGSSTPPPFPQEIDDGKAKDNAQ